MNNQDTNSTTKSDANISNCISGIFEPIKGDTSSNNRWSFCYVQGSQKVSLDVTIDTPTMLADIDNQQLQAEFNLEEVQQLLTWLFQVRSTMQQRSEQNGGASSPDN